MSPKPKAAPSAFDAGLAAVNATADLTPAEAEPLLRRFLTHRNNLIVSRAARAIARHKLASLTVDLAAAFPRFLPAAGDPIKTDPNCWAKQEIARALAAFEYQAAKLFVAGVHHHQLEPAYAAHDPLSRHPGRTDTAGPLRSTCALALVQCRELPSTDVLRHLTPLFSDEILTVRVDCARAIEQLGTDNAALLLRLRAELGSDEPELLSACIGGVLRIEGTRALPWTAAFLQPEDDLAHETAFLLAEHRTPAAIPHLTRALRAARNRNFRTTLLKALATTRLPEAYRFLLDLVATEDASAPAAAKALAEAQPPDEVVAELRTLTRS